MVRNVGGIDRVIRYILGVILVGSGFFLEGNLAWAAWGLGAVVLFTAQFRFCGAYTLLGISTCPRKDRK
jgi:hypothetical protein